jgi:group I intron endonuclease
MMGIYSLHNSVDQTMYVGQTQDFIARSKKHFSSLRSKTHGNPFLQRAFNKYGEIAFSYEPLEECSSVEECDKVEDFYIKYLRFLGARLYNLADGGGRTGWHLSEEAKARISAASKGREKSPEIRAMFSRIHKGKTNSLEARRKMSLARKGRPLSPAHCEAIRQAHLGEIFTEERKRNISLGKTGVRLSQQHKENIGLSKIGKKLTLEHRARISQGNKGKIRTPEMRAAMSVIKKQLATSKKNDITSSLNGNIE